MIDIGDFAPDVVPLDEKGRRIFSCRPQFALTLCLNAEHEGGHLNFAEYGKQIFGPAKTGSSVGCEKA